MIRTTVAFLVGVFGVIFVWVGAAGALAFVLMMVFQLGGKLLGGH